MPSVVAGSLLPVAVYWLVQRWTRSAWLGVFAAAMVVVDRLSIFYATEARPYALIELLAVLHVAIVVELAEQPTLRLRLAFVLGAALLFYLHYTSALLVLAEIVFFALYSLSHRERVANAASRLRAYGFPHLILDLFLLAPLLLPAAPNLLAIYARRDNWSAFVDQKPVWSLFSLLPWSGSVLVLIAGVVAHFWWQRKRGRESLAKADSPSTDTNIRQRLPTPLVSPLPPAPTLLAACWLMIPLTIAWTLTATDTARLFFPRYLMASAPAAFVLTAFCLRLVRWRYFRIGLATALLMHAIYSSQIIPQFRYDGRIIGDRQEDWRAAVAYLNEHLREHDYPILLRSGLIESNALRNSPDKRLHDYCLYPLTSLYPVQSARGDLTPLPTRDGPVDALIDDIAMPDRGMWIIDRGGYFADIWLDDPYPKRRAASQTIHRHKQFGNVHVYLLIRYPSPAP
jgi:hypothetical protein